LATRKNPEQNQSGRFTVGRINSVEKTCRKFLDQATKTSREKKEGMNYVHQVRESKRSDHINTPNVKIGVDGFRQRKKIIKETRNELACTHIYVVHQIGSTPAS
jgi:hypothetical protein